MDITKIKDEWQILEVRRTLTHKFKSRKEVLAKNRVGETIWYKNGLLRFNNGEISYTDKFIKEKYSYKKNNNYVWVLKNEVNPQSKEKEIRIHIKKNKMLLNLKTTYDYYSINAKRLRKDK